MELTSFPENGSPDVAQVSSNGHQNGHSNNPAAASLLQNVQHSSRRRFERSYLGSFNLRRFCAERSTGTKLELVLWSLGLILSISAVAMGAFYAGHCLEMVSMPVYIISEGIIGVIFMACILCFICVEDGLTGGRLYIVKVLFSAYSTVCIMEATFFVTVTARAESAVNCNKVFYYYSIAFSAFTILLVVIGWLRIMLMPAPVRYQRNGILLRARVM